jgi:hypothetical protein
MTIPVRGLRSITHNPKIMGGKGALPRQAQTTPMTRTL